MLSPDKKRFIPRSIMKGVLYIGLFFALVSCANAEPGAGVQPSDTTTENDVSMAELIASLEGGNDVRGVRVETSLDSDKVLFFTDAGRTRLPNYSQVWPTVNAAGSPQDCDAGYQEVFPDASGNNWVVIDNPNGSNPGTYGEGDSIVPSVCVRYPDMQDLALRVKDGILNGTISTPGVVVSEVTDHELFPDQGIPLAILFPLNENTVTSTEGWSLRAVFLGESAEICGVDQFVGSDGIGLSSAMKDSKNDPDDSTSVSGRIDPKDTVLAGVCLIQD